MFHGLEVCITTYLFVYIGIKRYKLLKKRYLDNGVGLSCHGNTAKQPKYSLKISDCEKILLFIRQYSEQYGLIFPGRRYSEQYGLILPGRVPGFKSADVVFLPSRLTKMHLYRQFSTACNAAGLHLVR